MYKLYVCVCIKVATNINMNVDECIKMYSCVNLLANISGSLLQKEPKSKAFTKSKSLAFTFYCKDFTKVKSVLNKFRIIAY